MSGTLIAIGLAAGVAGLAGRVVLRNWKTISQAANKLEQAIPGGAFSKYYRGGFEAEMSKREASLILGVSNSSRDDKIREAHKRIMLLNHPDRGGSPYLAAKINEAKDKLDAKKMSSR